ncbi:hypothetical protein BX265_8023 [Streptomyces sp. TLI_235]|nr:hypothetical protein [Streptomyces sp. TLI_235]PBC67421.1 hypothetical protein BX265_8023 [Streptomyces sp. TLI_235]
MPLHADLPQTTYDTRAVLERLDTAVRTGELVRIRRHIRGADRIEGFVVAVGPAWTLLASCTDTRLDGWTAVRTADIATVRHRGDETCLTVRALRRRGRWPVRPPAPEVPLDELPDLVAAACRGFGLVALHLERHRTDTCWIGTLTEVRRKSLRLHEVDPAARWHRSPTKFRFKDITRVDFGGHYEQTLDEFAGPRPGAEPLGEPSS